MTKVLFLSLALTLAPFLHAGPVGSPPITTEPHQDLLLADLQPRYVDQRSIQLAEASVPALTNGTGLRHSRKRHNVMPWIWLGAVAATFVLLGAAILNNQPYGNQPHDPFEP
jgi:hypothetical protein